MKKKRPMQSLYFAGLFTIVSAGGTCRRNPDVQVTGFHLTCFEVAPPQINTENDDAVGIINIGFYSDVDPVDYCTVTFRHEVRSNGFSKSFTLDMTAPNVSILWGNTTYGVAQWPVLWPRYTIGGLIEATQLFCHQGGPDSNYNIFIQRGGASAATLFATNASVEQVGLGDSGNPRLQIGLDPSISLGSTLIYALSTNVAQNTQRISVLFTDLPDRAGLTSMSIKFTHATEPQIFMRWPDDGAVISGNMSHGTIEFQYNFANGALGEYLFNSLEMTDNTGAAYCLKWGGCIQGAIFEPWQFLIAQAFGTADGMQPSFHVTNNTPPVLTNNPSQPPSSVPSTLPTAAPTLNPTRSEPTGSPASSFPTSTAPPTSQQNSPNNSNLSDDTESSSSTTTILIAVVATLAIVIAIVAIKTIREKRSPELPAAAQMQQIESIDNNNYASREGTSNTEDPAQDPNDPAYATIDDVKPRRHDTLRDSARLSLNLSDFDPNQKAAGMDMKKTQMSQPDTVRAGSEFDGYLSVEGAVPELPVTKVRETDF